MKGLFKHHLLKEKGFWNFSEKTAEEITQKFFELLSENGEWDVYLIIGQVSDNVSCNFSKEWSRKNVLKFNDPFWDSELK